MKKMFSLALALIMALALCVPAMADETNVGAADATNGSISIESETQDAAQYQAYKIFDVTYSGDNYAYTISTSSPWFELVEGYVNEEKNDFVLVGVPGDETTFVVDAGTRFSAPDFAGYLRCNMNDEIKATGTAFTNGVASDLDLGYWFVTSTMGSLCNLTTTNPDAKIYDKNFVPFEKTDDDESVEVGQTVNYTITGILPDVTGYASYTYEINDTMSAGLTYDLNAAVTFAMPTGGYVTLQNPEGWSTYTESESGFTLSLNLVEFYKSMPFGAGTEYTVNYSATVNENAVSVISKNSATLTYTNDPFTGTTTTTPPDEETVYSAKIVIDKYDSEDEKNKLEGATFVLKNSDGKYYKYEGGVVSWVEAVDIPATGETEGDGKIDVNEIHAVASEVTTNASGAAEFVGLEDGTYYLVETVAPTGYNLLANPVEIVVDGNKDQNVTVDGSEKRADDATQLTVQAKVENSTGTELPETGGMGTTIFYTVGGVMMAAAVVLFVTKKKLAVQE